MSSKQVIHYGGRGGGKLYAMYLTYLLVNKKRGAVSISFELWHEFIYRTCAWPMKPEIHN